MPNRIPDMIEYKVYSEILFPTVCCITTPLNMDKEGFPTTAEGVRVTEIID